jgi:predicted nucleic acid-binding protein
MHLELGWSFWDSMIIGACLDCGASTLYSEDLPGGKVPGKLKIINPFQ